MINIETREYHETAEQDLDKKVRSSVHEMSKITRSIRKHPLIVLAIAGIGAIGGVVSCNSESPTKLKIQTTAQMEFTGADTGNNTQKKIPAELPLPDEIPDLSERLKNNPIQFFQFHVKFHRQMVMEWSRDYQQAKEQLEQLERHQDNLGDHRVDSLEEIKSLEDKLERAQENMGSYSKPAPQYYKFQRDVERLEKQLQQYRDSRSAAETGGKNLSKPIRERKRLVDVIEKKKNYHEEQLRRSIYHFDEAIKEKAKED